MGDIINDQNDEQIEDQPKPIEPGTAGAPEGAAADPSHDEVKSLYEDLGIKAPVPTGATKGRPKTSSVRAEDASKKGTGSSNSGSKEENADDKDKSKDAPASDKNGGAGNKADAKGSKDGADDGQLQDESGDADKGVRGAKSRDEKDSERGREEDPERGASGNESAEHDEDGKAEGESDDEKAVKRPGKSNPEVEKRFQQLTAEKRAAEQRALELEQKLEENNRAVQQSKISQEDPEYTIEDFRKVRDREGNIIDLDPERAELAWRRWKDGYDQRAEQRQAESNRQASEAERESEMTRELMTKSAEAYDSLAALMDDYPELVSTSGVFDEDFAAEAMPIIHDSLEYLEGTEPGNPEGKQAVIVGLKIHPKKILDALRKVGNAKRTLPLNGVNDNVESRSNVSVPHSRSSDPNVNAANELYKELNINKRL